MSAVSTVIPEPAESVDALNGVFGPQRGTRASHAKGMFVTGEFVANGQAAAITRAPHLQAGCRSSTVARFSVGGGNPKASDKAKSVRGLSVRFDFDAVHTDLIMLSAPVFFVSKPEHFIGFFDARRPLPGTGAPDAAKIAAFNASHPDTKPHIDYLAAAPVPASYAAAAYWAINAFRFSDANGHTVHARWRAEPVAGRLGLTDEQLAERSDDFLVDELRERLDAGPVAFDLWLQVARDGDTVDDATVQWPEDRPQLNAGRLSLMQFRPPGDEDLMFDPVALVDGIAPSDDPILLARRPVYQVSRQRRG